MKGKIFYKGKKMPEIRGVLVVLILLSLITVPVSVSADENMDLGANLNHGTLDIKANNVVVPICSHVTESEIIRLANPSATHTFAMGGVENNPVIPTYFVSADDIKRINAARQVTDMMTIKLSGIYMYFCNLTCQKDVPVYGSTDIIVSFKPSEYKVVFNGNGGRVDKHRKKTVKVSIFSKDGGSVGENLMPESVKKKDYKFKGWSTSKEKFNNFTGQTLIHGNTTVYAHWKSDKDNKIINNKEKNITDKTITDKKISTSSKKDIHNPTKTRNRILAVNDANNDNSNGGGGFTDADNGGSTFGDTDIPLSYPDEISRDDFVSLAESQKVPLASIGKGNVPLYAPEGSSGWAFVNLLMSLTALTLMLICIAVSKKQGKNKKNIWFILPILSSVSGLVFFIITENMNYNMVLTDRWTVFSAALFAVTVISVIKYLRKPTELAEYIFKY